MKNYVVFEEKQRFTQWWLWLLLIFTNFLFLWGIFQQIIRGIPFGDKPMSDTGLLLVTGFVMFITLFIYFIRLETRIDKDGVYVHLFPFQLTFRFYPWEVISEIHFRTYNPIIEYGGWGWRWGLFGKGSAMNVSGDQGIQLIFKSGKKLLIGTQKPEEIQRIIEELEKH